MKLNEFILRMNHRQSLENSICDHNCLTCECFEQCQEDCRNDSEYCYDEVPLSYTRRSLFTVVLMVATFVGWGIYGIISVIRFFL